VVLPNNLTTIANDAFKGNKLTNVVIPETVTSIGTYAFANNLLPSVDISDSVTSIGTYAFSNNKLTNVIIPETVTNIGIRAFATNLLTSIVIPKNVTNIGNNAFTSNKLTSVKFLSGNAVLGTDIFSLNQATPANLIIEGYSTSTIESHASLKGFTFTVMEVEGTEKGVVKTSVLPGVMAISSFPSSLSFENYEISLDKPLLKLQSPFELTIDDFTGSRSGWGLSIVLTELVDGTDKLKNPSLIIKLTNVVINDADSAGLEAGLDTSPPGTFTKTDGTVLFGSAKKIISAQANNPNATTRHYFNFPADSLEIGFDNTTKTGTFTGTTTFILIASP
jgi:hypothetical protein